jgi:hypothetical protein
MANIGSLVNTAENNRYHVFYPDDTRCSWYSERAGGCGGNDLWWVFTDNLLDSS